MTVFNAPPDVGALRTNCCRRNRASHGLLVAVAVTAAASLLASGCAPVSESYFEPSAPGGETEPYVAHCGGAPEIIVFTPENSDWVKVRFGAKTLDSSQPNRLRVAITIEKRIAREFLLFPSVEAQRQRRARYNAKAEQAIVVTAAISFMRASWAGGHANLAIEFLDVDNRVILKGNREDFKAELTNFSGDWLLLEPPAMTFDGIPLDLPPIRFTRTEGIFAAPINC